MWWWWYYGSSVINQEFKQDVWGIPNELASVETLYDGPVKQVRLLENGRQAVRMQLDTAAVEPTARDATLLFRTVARRTTDDGENAIEIHDHSPLYIRPFKEGDLYVGHGTAVHEQLERVDFKPLFTSFYSGYNGVVKMYDEHGSAKRPRLDDGGEIKVKKLVDAIRHFAASPSPHGGDEV